MSNMPNQCYLAAALCSGSGPATIYVLQAVAKHLSPTLFYFQNAGSCYSVSPGDSVVDPPPSSLGPFANRITDTFKTCSECELACSLNPPSVYFDCSGTGSQPVTVAGAAGATIYLATSSNWIVLNGVGPRAGGVSATITLDASGSGSFTVATSGALTGGSVPCPAGPVAVEVGSSAGGNSCGTVEISTLSGCPDLSSQFPTVSIEINMNSGAADCIQEVGTFTLPSNGTSSWFDGYRLFFCTVSSGVFFWSYGYLYSETGGNIPFTGSPLGLVMPVSYVFVSPPAPCGTWKT